MTDGGVTERANETAQRELNMILNELFPGQSKRAFEGSLFSLMSLQKALTVIVSHKSMAGREAN